MSNKETENDGPSKSLGWWRIIWTVIRNILYLVVVLTVFEKMQSTFEIIVVSLLILIFESISWAHTAQVRIGVEETIAQRRISFTILQKLGEDTSEAQDEINHLERKYISINPLYYINSVGALIIYLAVLFQLFKVLF